MEKKKIFVLLGHPDSETYSGSLASSYEEGARKAGNEVHRLNLGELNFDPILHKGYKEIQELEPDLKKIQDEMNWADHVVIVYPNWWNTMPALLKGMFDRMFLPGFAFNFDKETKKLIPLLKGKSATVIIVAGTNSPIATRLKFGDFTNEIERGILKFAGFAPVNVVAFGPCEKVDQERRDIWINDVNLLGQKSK